MPPDRVCGRSSRRSCSPTSASRARARGPAATQRGRVAAQAVAQQHVVEHAEPGQQQVRLGHVGDGLLACRRPGSRPASQRSREVLPTPLRPSRQVVRPAANSSVRSLATTRSPKAMRALRTKRGGAADTKVTRPYAGTNRSGGPDQVARRRSFSRTSQPRCGSPRRCSHYEKAASGRQASSSLTKSACTLYSIAMAIISSRTRLGRRLFLGAPFVLAGGSACGAEAPRSSSSTRPWSSSTGGARDQVRRRAGARTTPSARAG